MTPADTPRPNDPAPVEPARTRQRNFLYAVNVNVLPQWRIRTPILYRYMDRKYVDEFFHSGKLRLSSFSEFSRHKDEERRDANEGFVITHAQSEDRWALAVGGFGTNAYVLCGTRNHNPDMQRCFGGSGFRILDTESFAAVIAGHVPEFIAGTEGECTYGKAPLISRRVEGAAMENLTKDKALQLQVGFNLMRDIAGDDPLFFKNQKYRHQAEYRLVWFCRTPVTGFLSIECPEARQFCERLEEKRR